MYHLTIAYNNGRDEQSRRLVSKHRTIQTAVRAYDRGGWGEGWAARVQGPGGTLSFDDFEMVRMGERARVAS